MNSIYYQQSELSVILEAHNLNSKVPNRERSEEKLMPSVLKDRFLSLNSHIFFFVVDQCKCRQRQASKTADICSAFEPQLPAKIIDVYKLTNFIFIVARSQDLISCPNELRTRKFIYVRFQLLSHLSSSKYSRRNTLSRSRQHQAIQLWLHLQQFKSPLTLSAEPLIG